MIFLSLRRVLIALLSLIGPATVTASVPAAAKILDRSYTAEGYESAYIELDQIITTSVGGERTLVIRSWAVDNGRKKLAEYLAPADIRGQKILMTEDGDNIWMFNPETRRTRKLGSHMRKKKVMGSDFTYEDQAGGKISTKYTGTILNEEEEGDAMCYVLDLVPTPEGPSYKKVVAWIGKSDFLTRRIDFYREEDDEPYKRLICTDIHQAGGRVVAHRFTMTNLEDGTRTVNVIKDIRFKVKLTDSIFEARNLDK